MKQFAIISLAFFFLLASFFIACEGVHQATLTLNSFEEGGDGGGPSACDGQYHSDNRKIVALSTQWFEFGGRKRCLKPINIYYKDRSVQATVVDECDSNHGCGTSIVDASRAVWDVLAVPADEYGKTAVTWEDA